MKQLSSTNAVPTVMWTAGIENGCPDSFVGTRRVFYRYREVYLFDNQAQMFAIEDYDYTSG